MLKKIHCRVQWNGMITVTDLKILRNKELVEFKQFFIYNKKGINFN